MGYVSRQFTPFAYTPTDTVLISNDAEQTTTNTIFTKVKEIQLIQTIYNNCRFRFIFDLKSGTSGSVHTAHGQIYKNGIAIGIEQTRNTNTYATFTEDINIGNWILNDTIELWIKDQDGSNTAYCRNFRIEGANSPFIDTLGA